MKSPFLLKSLFALALAAGLASPAMADYPDRAIKLVSPYAAGAGALDVAARVMAEKMGARLGSPVIVIHQPGASGTVAANATAKGPKDGYTMYLGTSSQLGYMKLLNKDLPYDPAKDFAPVVLLGSVPVGLFVSANSEIRTLQDLIAAAKARPDALNFSSPGVGSITHMAVEMLMSRAGIKMKHVPYGGSQGWWNDLIGGSLQVVSAGITGGLPLVKEGRLRLIGTATRERTKIAPDVPAVGELIPGYDAPAWIGLVVAQGTPEPIVAKLEAAAMAALNDPAARQVLAQAGIELSPTGRKDFAAKMANDLALWATALKSTGVSAN